MRQDGALYDYLVNKGIVDRSKIGSSGHAFGQAIATAMAISLKHGVPVSAFDAMRPLDDRT